MSNLDTKLANIRKRLDNIIHKHEFLEPTDGKIYSDFNGDNLDMRIAGFDYPVTLPSTAHLKQRRREHPQAPKPYGEKVDISLIPLEGAYPIPIRSIPPLNPRHREKPHSPILHQSVGEPAPRHPTQGFIYSHDSNTVPLRLEHSCPETTAIVNEFVWAREKLNERMDASVKVTERKEAKDALRRARAAEAMETIHETMKVLRERVKKIKSENGTGKMVVDEEDVDWTKVEPEEWVMVPHVEDY